MSDQPSGGRRIYLGRLPADVRKSDVEDFFSPIKFADCRVMGAFGFVEFESSRDADDAVRDYASKKLMGAEIIVEKAKDNPNRQRRDFGGGDSYQGGGGGGDRGGYGAPQQRRGPAPGRGVRVAVKGLTPDISWQDLKDFGREGGAVIYADVDRAGGGVIEYATMGEAETALDRLSTQEIRNIKPTVALDESRGGYRGGDDRGGSGGRDRDPYHRDRRPSPPRGGYGDRGGGSDRRYEDRRERDRSPRRERDRSPPRRDYDRESRRSPPPREYRRGDDRE